VSSAARLTLAETSLALAVPFRNAATTVGERRTILVGIDDGVHVGWGEAGPYPGVTADTIEIASLGLARAASEILSGGHPASLSPTARAAVDEARTDLAARRAGLPLWRYLGGQQAETPACAAIGIAPDIATLLEAVAAVVEAGYTAIKLKIEPGRDAPAVRAVIGAFPHITVGVDANGSYDRADDSLVREVAALAAYIEQPFAPGDLEAHKQLRGPGVTVVLDESISSPAAAAEAMAAGAADVVAVKPGRIGVDGCLRVMAHARSHGVAIKVSSLLESAVGRAHTLALATMSDVAMADIATSDRYFADDPWAGAIQMEQGMVSSPDAPGIGITVDTSRASGVRIFDA